MQNRLFEIFYILLNHKSTTARELAERFEVSQRTIYRDIDALSLAAFKTAIIEKRVAKFDYYSTYGEKTHRLVEPIQLWFKSRAWYIRCFDLDKEDLRLFKLTRVKNPTVTDEHFIERDLLTVKPTPPEPSHQRPDVTLKVKIAPEMTYRVYDEFNEDDVEKQSDASYVVTVTWPEDDWVYGWILSFGEYIEVFEPQHLREIIRGKMKKMRKNICKYDTT